MEGCLKQNFPHLSQCGSSKPRSSQLLFYNIWRFDAAFHASRIANIDDLLPKDFGEVGDGSRVSLRPVIKKLIQLANIRMIRH